MHIQLDVWCSSDEFLAMARKMADTPLNPIAFEFMDIMMQGTARQRQSEYQRASSEYARHAGDAFGYAFGARGSGGPGATTRPAPPPREPTWRETFGLQARMDVSKSDIDRLYRVKAMENHQQGGDQSRLLALNLAKQAAYKEYGYK